MRALRRFILRRRALRSPRVCECPPRIQIVEPDGSCYTCAAPRVRQVRVPFRPDDWRSA